MDLVLGEIDLATVRLATGYCWCTGRLLEYDVVQAYATGYCSLDGRVLLVSRYGGAGGYLRYANCLLIGAGIEFEIEPD